MATQCLDTTKLFKLIKGHKKVFIIIPREASKGDFVEQFFSMNDEDRELFKKCPADIRGTLRERDETKHRLGCTTVYLGYPNKDLGEHVRPGTIGRICFTGEEFSVRESVDINYNVPLIVTSSVAEGRRDTAFFVENGFSVFNAPLCYRNNK